VCALEDRVLVDEVIEHLPAWTRNLSTWVDAGVIPACIALIISEALAMET
jgi:hypothetical protein